MKKVILFLGLIILAACSPVRDLDGPADPLGDFRLGFNVVQVVDDVGKGPLSRDVSEQEWKDALQPALDRRFARFEGGHIYHLGVTVLGYVVAQPGIPLVLSPKSFLVFNVVVIDNETQKPLTEEPEQITVVETINGGNLVGSGLTSTKEEQVADLAERVAKATEDWMRKQPWFYRNDPVKQAALASQASVQ